MDVVRARVGAAFEWAVAAAFLAGTIAVASLIVQELRVTSAAPRAVSQQPGLAPIPAAVPARAISVPLLLLLDGKEIRVGDTSTRIALLLGRGAETGAHHIDRGPAGERMTRFYEHAGTRFILVFEPFNRVGESRVAAIYLQ